MQSLHQLANELNRERLAHAERQRPARHQLALLRASRQAGRVEQRMRKVVRRVLRPRAELTS